MKSLSIISLSVLSLLGLSLVGGCGKVVPDTADISPDQTREAPTIKATGISVCDNYLSTIQCIANSSTGTDKTAFDNNYQSLVQSFKDIPAEQLTKTCTTLSDALRSHPTVLKNNPNCNTL